MNSTFHLDWSYYVWFQKLAAEFIDLAQDSKDKYDILINLKNMNFTVYGENCELIFGFRINESLDYRSLEFQLEDRIYYAIASESQSELRIEEWHGKQTKNIEWEEYLTKFEEFMNYHKAIKESFQ